MKPTVSFLIVIRNAADLLEKRLHEIDRYVDEIVVVHDGEPDDLSLEIGFRFTDKVILAPYEGYCEPQRQVGLEQCSSDWVLVGDADEEFDPAFLEKMSHIIEQCESLGHDGVVLKRWEKQIGPHEITPHCRLFKRGRAYLSDVIHTHALGIRRPLTLTTPYQFVHHSRTDGAQADEDAVLEKNRRYAAIQERLRLKYADRPEILARLDVDYGVER